MSNEIEQNQTEQTTEELFTFQDLNERAGMGKRFLNFLIDGISFYILFTIFLGIIRVTSPSFYDILNESIIEYKILYNIVSSLIYSLYVGAVEGLCKGKTLGKVFTQTRAVYNDGTKIRFNTGILRGLIKSVPFVAFSALSTPCIPWQDKWTDTMVVVEKD